ncbi:S-formylglutathione hydrolase [Nitrincola sp. A-D6]|uniref:S-formylglutathione hydrolase n=1 Tax=Nitrincola sp. A-D6 TaxID=1545442 RepID=UPI00051FA044|nr:S-formylglutathione hydrolase [Nitrincola sp. A-D6]KGK42169.1 S-formylglutathione hydrolase [Nitrincola sp. A-D6]
MTDRLDESLELLSSVLCFGGQQNQYQHRSAVLNCTMQLSVFLPPQAERHPVPALYWLSGLTCTDQNFATKAGAQRVAAELGMALIMPDTSPRGEGVPDDEAGAYDFGLGAGFYVNATEAPWAAHYRMYDYILTELPELLEGLMPLTEQRAISGHSMGGHGALMLALRNAGRFTSVSAFSPIVNPSECPWGQKAFSGYLGSDQSSWKAYDSVELIRNCATPLPVLVDQGRADNFLDEQLKTDRLIAACESTNFPAEIRYQPGYDHSYYFIASFIESHLRFHAKHLGLR